MKGLSYEEISELLFVSKRSVQRYVDIYRATNTLAPASQKHGPAKFLSDFEQEFLLESLIANPSVHLSELCEQLQRATGTVVHPSTVCRTIHHFGMTRKKIRTIALQRSENRRAEFMAEISQFDANMLVWIDETGSDRRNSVRAYGYAIRGLTPERHNLRVGGKRISAIGVMTTGGIEDAYLAEGGVNGDVFEHFVRTSLLPILQPFNGSNPRSVVILDNAAIHHLEQVEDMITGVGAIIRFMPPYSPDLMPLEEAFSQAKAFLRANDSVYHATMSPRILVSLAFSTITQTHCINYIRHAGYTH